MYFLRSEGGLIIQMESLCRMKVSSFGLSGECISNGIACGITDNYNNNNNNNKWTHPLQGHSVHLPHDLLHGGVLGMRDRETERESEKETRYDYVGRSDFTEQLNNGKPYATGVL